MNSQDAYSALVTHLKHAAQIESIQELLGWDEQVNLPDGSAGKRADESAALAAVYHREASSPKIDEWLSACEADLSSFSEDKQCVITHARKDYNKITRLTEDYVSRRSRAESEAYHAWAKARANNDFASYAPHLEKLLALCHEEAELQQADNAYDYFIDRHDPGMTAELIDDLFSELKEELVPFSEAVLNSDIKARADLFKGFPVEKQKAFLTDIIGDLGFDFQRGRIDIALHPFCGGSGQDTRMTTRYHENVPLDSLYSSIHETGHGLYEQGLPAEHFGTALGESIGMGVHESQSRMWENQVCRSREFWQYAESKYRSYFGEQLDGVSSDELYLAVNSVSRIPIRVDSDEVTYNLHVMLRFNIEKRLFSGELKVADLPEAWNALAEELLGLTPKNDSEGVLQDVHWSGGAFGYFPSYCLGNMMAAQLWYALREQITDVDAQIAKGDFKAILDWLRENVHQHGKRYDTVSLIQRATGETLSPKALIRYLKERYGALYL